MSCWPLHPSKLTTNAGGVSGQKSSSLATPIFLPITPSDGRLIRCRDAAPKGFSDYLIGNPSLRPCGVFNRLTNSALTFSRLSTIVSLFVLSLVLIAVCSA